MNISGRNHAIPKLWRSMVTAAIIPVFFTVLGLWLSLSYQRNAQQLATASLSIRQIAMVEQILADLKDTERNERGYALTGDPALLSAYAQAKISTERRLALLERLTPGHDQRTRNALKRLEYLTHEKFAQMQTILEARDQGGLQGAAIAVQQQYRTNSMAAITAQTQKIIQSKNQQVSSNEGDAVRRSLFARFAYWLIVLVITLISFTIAYVIWANRTARRIALRTAHDALERQTALFESDFNAVILINPSGGIEVMNGSAEKLFGYPKRDIMRRDISLIADLGHGDGPFLQRIGLTAAGLADPVRTEIKAKHSDGTIIPVEVALGVMPQDDGDHIVASFRDVSEREKIEQMKDQFLSNVSHELRTPLTSIVGSLALLKRSASDEVLRADAQRLIVIAESNAHRLIRIVNDLLDVQKMQSGEMIFELEPHDVRTLGDTALDGVRGFADQQGVALQGVPADGEVIARIDGERIIQVITNLLSNAIKFSPKGGTVTLRVFAGGGNAHIAVTDQGPGIDAELRKRLFSRFAQSVGRTATPGTGLGLAISREIVHNHGGTIGFEDAPGGGTTFTVAIPIWDTAPQQQLQGKPRLLVYADVEDAQEISTNFAAKSIAVDVVTNPAAVTETLKNQRYAAMILDFQFADADAIAVVQAIRADPASNSLPVIAIAAHDHPLEANALSALDIIDCIPKPIDGGRLHEAIGAALSQAAGSMPLVLHVDDDSDTLEITAQALEGLARIAKATDVASARAFLENNRPDIAIIDIGLPDGSGLDILADVTTAGGPAMPVIIYSAQDSTAKLASNVEAMLTKSKRSLPNLVDTVLSIIARQKAVRESEQ